MKTDREEKPWGIKTLNLSLGGMGDEKGFITFEIFNDDYFSMYEGSDPGSESMKWFYEGIDLEAARILRDFLNYAVPPRAE